MMVAIEDVGFDIRDTLMWLHGQGFPKSKNVAAAIDKHLGYPNRGRAIPMASTRQAGPNGAELFGNPVPPYQARSDAALGREGWGTALKPAYEPIILARKPLIGTVAENVLAFGTGGLNIDSCRVPIVDELGGNMLISGIGWDRLRTHDEVEGDEMASYGWAKTEHAGNLGRWPANILHDGSDEVMEIFARFGERKSCKSRSVARSPGSIFGGSLTQGNLPLDAGTAARFFIVLRRRGSNAAAATSHGQTRQTARMARNAGHTARRHSARSIRWNRQHRTGCNEPGI